jgi:hypothetical protein
MRALCRKALSLDVISHNVILRVRRGGRVRALICDVAKPLFAEFIRGLYRDL